MARAGLGMTAEALAATARVSKVTLSDFEIGKRSPHPRTLAAIRAVLEAAGVEFTNGDQPGVRIKSFKLKDTGKNAYLDDDPVSKFVTFAAKAGERWITIRVEDLALEHLEPDISGGADYMRALEKHRGRIFRIAAQKYELEQSDIISIRYSDVAQRRES